MTDRSSEPVNCEFPSSASSSITGHNSCQTLRRSRAHRVAGHGTGVESVALARTDRIENAMSSRELPLPTFLIIGAQKSATRWLRLNIGLHPEVYAASTELEFFNNGKRFDELGVPWYREQFAGWSGEPVIGEATPGYMFWRHRPTVCVERIESVVPNARLIALLRNPVDRALSAMVHHIAYNKLPKDSDLLEIVRGTQPTRDPLGLMTGGWYAASLEPFRQRFGAKLLVLLHDDITGEPRRAYERALRHIGAAPSFLPPDLDRVRFSYQDRPGFEPDSKQTLNLEQRRQLYEYFADDISKL